MKIRAFFLFRSPLRQPMFVAYVLVSVALDGGCLMESGSRRSPGQAGADTFSWSRAIAPMPEKSVIAWWPIGRITDLTSEKLDPLISGLNRVLVRAENTASDLVHDLSLSFGDVFALHELCKDIGFARVLGRARRSGNRQLNVEALVRILVFSGCANLTGHRCPPGRPLRRGRGGGEEVVHRGERIPCGP
nr:hypothetical protein [Cereibacter sediminicola]